MKKQCYNVWRHHEMILNVLKKTNKYSSKPFNLKSLLISHSNANFSILGNYKYIYHSIKVTFPLSVIILGKGKKIKINFSNYKRPVK